MTVETLNPRLNPYSDAVAASHLKGKVNAKRYVGGQIFQVCAPVAGLYRSSNYEGGLDTQALMGEIFTVYDVQDGWSWGQLEKDKYVGWIQSVHLSDSISQTAHKVGVLRTIVFSDPDLKTPAKYMLSINAEVCVLQQSGKFSEISTGGWVFTEHLVGINHAFLDYVSIAEKFLNAPYLWGGKDSFGLDCSGLVQSAMTSAGFCVPRDAYMQEEAIGSALNIEIALNELQRGDLVFWPGHVGIMQNQTMLLHANAHHMMCAVEPLSQAIERIAQKETAVRSIKRPSSLFKS